MTALVWDKLGERFFETGIDRGVLYLDGQPIAWSGLTAIEEDIENDTEPLYFDGLKTFDLPIIGDFKAKLSAFTYPDEFLECEGIFSEYGLDADGQTPKQFGLSYRTRVGNDVSSTDHAYKIHILWNLTAIPEEKSYSTHSSEQSAMEFSWVISSVPEDAPGYRPTGHMVFDTRDLSPILVSELETMLYGSASVNPSEQPNLADLIEWATSWAFLRITDNGDGTWTAEENPAFEGQYITMLDATTFHIDTPSAEFTGDPTVYKIVTLYDYGIEAGL